MSADASAKRLHFGWVMALAFGVMEAGFWQIASYFAVRACENTLDHVVPTTLFLSVFVGIPLSLWLWLTWGIFDMAKRWHGRAWVALLPALLFTTHVIVALNPPTPQKCFERSFKIAWPADAQNVELYVPAFDGGYTEITLTCSRATTQKMIAGLGLKEAESAPSFRRRQPSPEQPDALCFDKIDRNGWGYFLVTDKFMRNVRLICWPWIGEGEDDALTREGASRPSS